EGGEIAGGRGGLRAPAALGGETGEGSACSRPPVTAAEQWAADARATNLCAMARAIKQTVRRLGEAARRNLSSTIAMPVAEGSMQRPRVQTGIWYSRSIESCAAPRPMAGGGGRAA